MAITSEPPTTETTAVRAKARPQIIAHEIRPEPKGWTSWITTTDHKKIGIMYLYTTLVFFCLGGVEALLLRIQLGVAGEHVPLAREVQPALHDARDDDDLPGRRAGLGRVRELPRAADDRRARRRLPAHQRLVVLDVPVRRHRALRVDVLHPARGRLVLLRAALAEGVLAQRRPGRVDLHGPPHRPGVDARRGQLHRHDPQHARARHGLGPPPAVRVDDPHLRLPDRDRAVRRSRPP